LKEIFRKKILTVESMDDSGKLTVDIQLHPAGEPYVRIGITDTGCGIPKNELHRIFNRYHTTKETGTGLGLAIVERVIEAHNGRLSVELEQLLTFICQFSL